MSVIRLGGFQGELPRIHPRLLPEGRAQTALNVRLDSGALDSVRDTLLLQATTLGSPISLYRYSDTIWLESVSDNDWVPYPITNDAFGRLIYVDPSVDELRVTDAASVGTGGTPLGYTRLDVPPPTQGFSVALVGDANDAEEVPETRFYVCTFVNNYGAEGPPSPPSNQVEWRTGQTVSISSLPAVPSGAYNITHRRIYRLNTGSTGATNYQFVTEIAVTLAQKVIDSITQANPVVVTTTTAHGLTTGQEVIFTNLGTSSTKPVTNVLKQNPVQLTVPNHGFSSGWTVAIEDLGGANGMDELDGTRAVVSVVDIDRIELTGVDATAFTTYVSGGTAARAFGMDELDDNTYFVSVIDATSFALDSVDGTAYKPYIEEGITNQVAGTTYIDTVASASLAEVIPTDLYDPPNPATEGIKEHPAGFLAGFYGKTLTFSEPGAPHAWPIDYRLNTGSDIVGLGVFGNSVAVMTKGWPYLAVGSDPSAMTLVELEIEQACVSRRSIVDFGSAVAYASPDGLIVISGNGATNATSGIYTRDQWQALVPTSFVAFNWEQQYLCFYNDGTTQRAFVVDPFDPAAGVRYINKHATGGYKDLEEDLLYLIVDGNIEKWDQSTTKLQYTWKSKPVYTPRAVNMSAAKVIADTFPVRVEFRVDGVKRYERLVSTSTAFRLPGGFRGEKFELIVRGTRRVSEVIMATTMAELSATV